MRLLTISAEANPNFSKLSLSLASTHEEVREVQRLRYKVFIEAMGLPKLSNQDGLDRDDFDDYCDHLIVRDTKTLEVVGTYRVLSPHAARRIGRLYSEQEFDLNRLEPLRGSIAEAGRACIHPDYRGGGVIMLLWTGLAAYMKKENCTYLIGCASVSLADGGYNATALYHALAGTNMAPAEYRVTPRLPFPIHEPKAGHRPQIPPLIKGYLRGGAWVCGEPAWDPDFHCADLFMLLPLANLDRRYARHYLKETRSL
ncbi:MAG TPA: GNAT family N-acyltransferase [Burkholderiaceae bacterium]|nr:GNAT family N-acyltransferase [Burkholderiaceae bacterium]